MAAMRAAVTTYARCHSVTPGARWGIASPHQSPAPEVTRRGRHCRTPRRKASSTFSDNELNPAVPYESPASWRRDLIEFIARARILVHDTMFTTEEYTQHRGWGHSTYEDAVDLALEAGVETLVLFHHKPERSDDDVDRHTDACRALAHRRGGTLEIIAAAEGLSLQA